MCLEALLCYKRTSLTLAPRRCMGTSDGYHLVNYRCHAFGVGGATADPRVAGYHDARSRCDGQRPPDHGDTIRYWRTSTVVTSNAAYVNDTSAWTTLRFLHDAGCLRPREMEEVGPEFLAGQFWTRWRREDIHNLQIRTKWNKEHRDREVGDIVLMKDEQAHPDN